LPDLYWIFDRESVHDDPAVRVDWPRALARAQTATDAWQRHANSDAGGFDTVRLNISSASATDEKDALQIFASQSERRDFSDDLLMARIDPDLYEEALTRPGCRAMDFTGRPMRGFVFVVPEEADSVAEWVQLCLDCNPKAKRTKKRKKRKQE
tara:strand:+ start:974 stop:1432 length:459 start_codon:yes stop_codon:yes gene_type:complete